MPSTVRQQLAAAMSLPGFQNWRPRVDVPELNRPMTRPSELAGSGRTAAVMVLIFPVAKMPGASGSSLTMSKLVLTKRHADLSKHASQISFPGGQQDPGETLEQTALRETHEEIGIAPSAIEVLGQLNSVYIPLSDFTVTPFVGWHANRPGFFRHQQEVEAIIEVSVAELLKPTTLVFGEVSLENGDWLSVPFYEIDPHQVWGATAIILGELIERLSRVS